MPRIVDHTERRRRIAEALLRIAAERGLESVTVREVAAGAGVSPGMVQHYFKTKDEMMAFALDVVQERVRGRLDASLGGGDEAWAPTAFVRALLRELLPRDRRPRDEARVTLAFLAHAAVDPGAARVLREDTAALLRMLTDGVADAQASGTIRADLDPAHVARALLALVDGLGLHVLSGHYGPDDAMATFDAYTQLLR